MNNIVSNATRRACVFVHYDQDDFVDEYVYYYLKELLTVSKKLIFVTVSDISAEDLRRLNNLNISVIRRENEGYDFYSYKVGMENLDFDEYDELIICNDSVYGPLYSLQKVFEDMKDKECDFWGITGSRARGKHLLAYFIVFRKTVLHSKVFKSFWDNLIIIDDKTELIEKYQVGLSQLLYGNNFRSLSYVSSEFSFFRIAISLYRRHFPKDNRILRVVKMPFSSYFWYYYRGISRNTVMDLWDEILIHRKMPFIKKRLFSNDIETDRNRNIYKSILKKTSEYPIELIEKHLERTVDDVKKK